MKTRRSVRDKLSADRNVAKVADGRARGGDVRGGRAPRAVAREIGVVDARVRRLDVLVRVRDIRGLHGEVIDQHGARSADLASRPPVFRTSSAGGGGRVSDTRRDRSRHAGPRAGGRVDAGRRRWDGSSRRWPARTFRASRVVASETPSFQCRGLAGGHMTASEGQPFPARIAFGGVFSAR